MGNVGKQVGVFVYGGGRNRTDAIADIRKRGFVIVWRIGGYLTYHLPRR